MRGCLHPCVSSHTAPTALTLDCAQDKQRIPASAALIPALSSLLHASEKKSERTGDVNMDMNIVEHHKRKEPEGGFAAAGRSEKEMHLDAKDKQPALIQAPTCSTWSKALTDSINGLTKVELARILSKRSWRQGASRIRTSFRSTWRMLWCVIVLCHGVSLAPCSSRVCGSRLAASQHLHARPLAVSPSL